MRTAAGLISLGLVLALLGCGKYGPPSRIAPAPATPAATPAITPEPAEVPDTTPRPEPAENPDTTPRPAPKGAKGASEEMEKEP